MKKIHIELANEACIIERKNSWLNKYFPVWDSKNYHIELSGQSTEEQTGSLLHTLTLETLSSRKYTSEKRLFDDLIQAMYDNKASVSGGLLFTGDDGTNIHSGCCCYMEEWQEIKTSLIQGYSPWMGHDPYTNLKVNDNVWLITTESEYDSSDEYDSSNEYSPQDYYSSIPFREEEFKKHLVWLDVEFYDFVNGPLQRYLEKYHPKYATRFCQAFIHRFGGLRDNI